MYEDILLLCLDEEGALVSDMGEEGLDVDLPLGSQLLQHGVDDDVGSSPAHPGTAVDNHWPVHLLEIKNKTFSREKFPVVNHQASENFHNSDSHQKYQIFKLLRMKNINIFQYWNTVPAFYFAGIV